MAVSKKSLINSSATRKTVTAKAPPKTKASSTVESAKMVAAARLAKAAPNVRTARVALAKSTTAL